MSFFDAEAQSSRTQIKKNEVSNKVMNTAADLIVELAEQLKVLKRECSKVGSKRDSTEVRNHIETEIVPNCNSIRDKAEEQIWSSNEEIRVGSKLYSDFQMLKIELQQVEREYTDKKMKHIIKNQRSDKKGVSELVRGDPESGYVSIQVNEQTPLLLQDGQREQSPQQLQQHQLAQLQEDSVSQDELDFNTIIQRERSQQITRIHSAVQEVNAIFHQLGTLVNEQGEQVDSIDGNIGHLSNNMQKANEELNRADEHQRQRNRCGLITLVVMVVVVLIAILAVLS